MERLAHFIFEALFLKHVQRSGYQFLGAGRESVAEHVYAAAIIGFILSKLEPRANTERLLCMCLFHDLPEARIGDLNYVQKRYVHPDESSALTDATIDLPFGSQIEALLEEFNTAESLEAQLAHDADQMALMADLKQLRDLGYQTPQQWLPHIEKRLRTKTARQLAEALLTAPRDEWWLKIFY